MKKITLTTDNSNWMRSHEQSYLTVTSPTGKSVTIKKAKQRTDKESKLIRKLIDNEMCRNTALKVQVTLSEMNIIHKMSQH